MDTIWPPMQKEARNFAVEFARQSVLGMLKTALNAPAADTYFVDTGYDCSLHAAKASETNAERAARGVSLSGHDDPELKEHGLFQEASTIGDLWNAPDGSTRPTYLSGAGLAPGTWAEWWRESEGNRCESLGAAWVAARLVIGGDIPRLEKLAGKQLGSPCAEDLLALANCARMNGYEETGYELYLNPEELVKMSLPLTRLPSLIAAAQRRTAYTEQEMLTLTIAEIGWQRG